MVLRVIFLCCQSIFFKSCKVRVLTKESHMDRMKSRSHCKAAVHPTHSGQPNTHGCGSISLSLPWQGVIDHGPMWDLEMKTAGVFTGGECRVTERWACWWNRQADRGTESEPLLTHAPFMTRETQLKRPRLWMQQLLWLASRPPACPEWLLEPSPAFLNDFQTGAALFPFRAFSRYAG